VQFLVKFQLVGMGGDFLFTGKKTPPAKNTFMEIKMKNRFSMRNKLMLVFGMLIFVACLTLGIFAVRTARKAVTEKIEAHLMDKAGDVAEIIEGRVTAFFQFLDGIARMPLLVDNAVPYNEKFAFCFCLAGQ